MTDTPPEVERMVRERLMARTAEERFIMGAQMFEAALTMIRASLPRDLPEEERRRQLFERIYGPGRPPWDSGPQSDHSCLLNLRRAAGRLDRKSRTCT
jgi:hypothetical protein